jgi:hypothetical protein
VSPGPDRQRQRLLNRRRDAALKISELERKRQDTHAEIRRAESAHDERTASWLRRQLPRIEQEISKAHHAHDRLDRELERHDRRNG